MRRTVLLLATLLGTVLTTHGQADSTTVDEDVAALLEDATAPEAEPPPLTYADWKAVSDDTIAVDRRAFDAEGLALLKADPDLDYDRTAEAETLWWDRLMRWVGRKLRDLLGSKAGEVVFDHLEWILLGTVGVFLVIYFRKRLFYSAFGAAAKRARQVTEVEEDLERLDLDGLLATAEKDRNWRMALRYHYLKVLRRLVDEGRIDWQPRYTDQDYLRQLKDPATRAVFSELSFLFKWVWYGDAPMDQDRYRALKPGFVAFHSSVRPPHPPTPGAPGTPA